MIQHLSFIGKYRKKGYTMTIKLYGMSIINLVFWLTFSVTGTEWKFDFGSNSSPAANGWIRISERDLYSPEKGYGWQAKWAYPGSYDKVNEPDLKTFLAACRSEIFGFGKSMSIPIDA